MMDKIFFVCAVFLVSLAPVSNAFAQSLPALADDQMSHARAKRLATVYKEVLRREGEGKPVSSDEISDALIFVSWARGFAEGVAWMQSGKNDQDVRECMKKHGYGFASIVIAEWLTADTPKPKNSDAQVWAYTALILGCELR
jgi:hypothetical protein